MVVYWSPAAAYTQFLSEFSDLLASLVVSSDKDFNIHMGDDPDSLNTPFNSLLDPIGFSQLVNEPTHRHNHTQDVVLTYGLEAENLLVVSQNHLLSDHSLITFDFTLADQAADDSKVCYSRCVSDDTRDKIGAEIASLLPLAPLSGAPDNTDINVTPA